MKKGKKASGNNCLIEKGKKIKEWLKAVLNDKITVDQIDQLLVLGTLN